VRLMWVETLSWMFWWTLFVNDTLKLENVPIPFLLLQRTHQQLPLVAKKVKVVTPIRWYRGVESGSFSTGVMGRWFGTNLHAVPVMS